MRKKKDEDVVLEKKDLLIFKCGDIEYVTFPQAWKYITGSTSREALHQKVMRKTVEGILRVDKYIFVPLDYVEKSKTEADAANKIEDLKELSQYVSAEKLKEFLAAEKAKAGKEQQKGAK